MKGVELHNSWKLVDDDWWDWSAYLTGPDVAKVDRVEYVLHPTFKNPVRVISDPEDGFRMKTSGWGTFELRAIVHMKDGKQQLLTREIKLESDPKKGRTDK